MEELKKLIENSTFLGPGDKEFLLSKLSSLGPVDKLKLKYSLSYNQEPVILKSLHDMRQKLQAQTAPKVPNQVNKLFQSVFKPSPPKIVSVKILDQTQYLGTATRYVDLPAQLPNLNSLLELKMLEQLVLTSTRHLDKLMLEDSETALIQLTNQLEDLFETINDFGVRRGYLALFMNSPLARSYIQTGLIALSHPELEPTSVILNTLYQIDNQYLNMHQFEIVASITNTLRRSCGL